MKRVWKWALWIVGALFVLGVIGALFGEEEDDPAEEQAAKPTATETSTSTPTPTPTPRPEVAVAFTGPYETTSDSVTLHGTVEPKGAKVRVKGANVQRSGRRWTAQVTTGHKGDNSWPVVATRAGYVADRTRATVTRNLSVAEKAVIRQEKAEARANRRALESAESYLALSGFSKQGLYEQLSSSYGEGFTQAQAQYAVDHVDADWNKEAVQSARSYLEISPMSRSGLIEQLSSSAGDGFTYEQALYAVNKVY